jgi:hypothetical protein
MIAGVFFVYLGEAVLAASLPSLVWFVVFVVGNAAYIPLVEDPGLLKRFGSDYLTCNQTMPKWHPRLRGWPTQPPSAFKQ